MYGLTYEDEYFYIHQANAVETLMNVLKDNFKLSVFKKDYGFDIYGMDIKALEALFKDMGLFGMVSFMDYQDQYGYDEYCDPITSNTNCVEVSLKLNIYDLKEL